MAEVARTLRDRVRGVGTGRVDQDDPARRGGGLRGLGDVQPIDLADGEVPRHVAARDPERVDVRRRGGRVQSGGARGRRTTSSKLRVVALTSWTVFPVFVTVTPARTCWPGRPLSRSWVLLTTRPRPAAGGLFRWRPSSSCAALHGRQRVQQAGALLIRRVAEVGRGAGQQLLDQGRRRPGAAVGVLVRLDDERGRARGQRRRLAGAAEVLDRRRACRRRSCTPRTGRGPGCTAPSRGHRARPGPARPPAWVMPPELRPEMLLSRSRCRSRTGAPDWSPGLQVRAEGRGRGHADDPAWAAGRGADGAGGPGVAGAGDHGDAGGDRGVVGQRDRVVAGVRERVAAERLVQHVGAVRRRRSRSPR